MRAKGLSRYAYSIDSADIRKAGWDYDYPYSFTEGIENLTIISLADSQLMRFIDEINGRGDVAERAQQIRDEIDELKMLPSAKRNSTKISQLYAQLYNMQIVPEYLIVHISNVKDYRHLNKGFAFNGRTYRRLVSTPGGLKESNIVYTTQEMWGELNERMENGRDATLPLVPSKLEAYKSLVCSSSVPLRDPGEIVVIHDCYTKFREDVVYVKDGKTEPEITDISDYEIELDASDGFGLADPQLMREWGEDIGEREPVTGLCLRNAFCKGMIYPFDFKEFAKQVARSEQITDVWGNVHNVANVRLILTESMLKLWKAYDSIENYINQCQLHNYTFSATKAYTGEPEDVKRTNYQFLQTLHFDDKDIEELLIPPIDEIRKITNSGASETLIYLCGTHLSRENCFLSKENWVKALMIEPDLINDVFVRSKIKKMLKKRIDELKFGRIPVEGNFQVLSGDPYALLQSAFGLPVTGLLADGEYYSSFWDERGVESVVCFRAPMTSHHNIRIGRISTNENVREWYKHMRGIFIINAWDSTMAALNGCDFDGDLLFSTCNPVILRGIKQLPTVMCEQKAAAKKVVTEDDIVESNIGTFGSKIGQITNRLSEFIDLLSLFPEDSEQHRQLMYRITCGQHVQQAEIDELRPLMR